MSHKTSTVQGYFAKPDASVIHTQSWLAAVSSAVKQTLAEDLGTGDLTAALIPPRTHGTAYLLARESAVLCGQAWVNEVFRQFDPTLRVHWYYQDGQRFKANSSVFSVQGPVRTMLSAERTAINYLQTLSGVATTCRYYADLVAGTAVKLLDTRKTIPKLRFEQKYAVTQGGCLNHRIGLYDAILIKENHILAAGGLCSALQQARQVYPTRALAIEVESLEQCLEACQSDVQHILFDNTDIETLQQAVKHVSNTGISLETSGNIIEKNILEYARTGVHYISLGVLTKHLRAIDCSLQLTDHRP